MERMKLTLAPGKYVIAVSGGVDSMALLDLLADLPDVRLTVAHYDHGIRDDSAEDCQLVQAAAAEYGLPFAYRLGRLGPAASEATARTARYQFLHALRRASGAQAIITAHHQDDVLETIVLNLLRGTGPKGLASLRSTDVVQRPLLQVPKQELLRYAKQRGLVWREDSTNADLRYARNYVRHRLVPRFAEADRLALLELGRRTQQLNEQIAVASGDYLRAQPSPLLLDRHNFVMLPHVVAREIMAEWLRTQTETELTRSLLERLVVAAKVGRSGSRVDVDGVHWLEIDRTTLALKPRER